MAKRTDECEMCFFSAWSVCWYLDSKKIIGTAKFKGELLMKITFTSHSLSCVVYKVIRLSVNTENIVQCTFPEHAHTHGASFFFASRGRGWSWSWFCNWSLAHLSRNPVSRNDNVDDALNIIEIEVALVDENIHFSPVLYILLRVFVTQLHNEKFDCSTYTVYSTHIQPFITNNNRFHRSVHRGRIRA